jgi:hypothetical protein
MDSTFDLVASEPLLQLHLDLFLTYDAHTGDLVSTIAR